MDNAEELPGEARRRFMTTVVLAPIAAMVVAVVVTFIGWTAEHLANGYSLKPEEWIRAIIACLVAGYCGLLLKQHRRSHVYLAAFILIAGGLGGGLALHFMMIFEREHLESMARTACERLFKSDIPDEIMERCMIEARYCEKHNNDDLPEGAFRFWIGTNPCIPQRMGLIPPPK